MFPLNPLDAGVRLPPPPALGLPLLPFAFTTTRGLAYCFCGCLSAIAMDAPGGSKFPGDPALNRHSLLKHSKLSEVAKRICDRRFWVL